MGACGCGSSSGSMFTWQLGGSGFYTAAGSAALFGSGTWCSSGCGTCYQLTSTGSAPCSSCGTGGDEGQSITVMVTNLCPYNGNAQWCPETGSTNEYGYGMSRNTSISLLYCGNYRSLSFFSLRLPYIYLFRDIWLTFISEYNIPLTWTS
jgi:hypothetical protein